MDVAADHPFACRAPRALLGLRDALQAKELALHIASAAPLAIDKDGVDPEIVAHERKIYEQQVRESGKPENLVPKIVDGKVEAYYKEVVLLSQAWVREPKKTVGDLIKEASAKLGENVTVKRFVRYQLGQ